MLYAIVIDPVYRDIQNVAHRVQVVKGVDGLNRGPTAMGLRCGAGDCGGLHGSAERCAAWRGLALNLECSTKKKMRWPFLIVERPSDGWAQRGVARLRAAQRCHALQM